MEAVIAGWVAGYAMAIASTAALAYVAGRARTSRWVEERLGSEFSAVMLAVPLFMGVAILWTLIGLVLATVYVLGDMESGPAALGAPSLPFLVTMTTLAAIPLVGLLLVSQSLWWLWSALSALFVALFGWVMPILAGQ